METIFKVGMEVYDYVFFGKTPLKITEVKEDMTLRVLCGEVIYCYTGDGRFIGEYIPSNRNRCLSQTSTLSTSPYVLQGFEQKAPAPTIEDALDWFNSDEFKNLSSPNKSSIDKIDEQLKALKELLVLRDYYNKGEVFDRVDFHGGGVYSIRLEDAGSPHFEIVKVCNAEYPFTFWDKDTAEKFMNEQSFLLSIAKPLL